MCHRSSSLALLSKPHSPFMLRTCCKPSFLLLDITGDNTVSRWALTSYHVSFPCDSVSHLYFEINRNWRFLQAISSPLRAVPTVLAKPAELSASAWACSAYSGQRGTLRSGGERKANWLLTFLRLTVTMAKVCTGLHPQPYSWSPSKGRVMASTEEPQLPLPGWGLGAVPTKHRGHPKTLWWGWSPLDSFVILKRENVARNTTVLFPKEEIKCLGSSRAPARTQMGLWQDAATKQAQHNPRDGQSKLTLRIRSNF